jgi:hypothetical protein
MLADPPLQGKVKKKAHRCRDLTDAHQRALHARQAALT